MNDKFIEDIYDTMIGELIPEFCVPGIHNEFEEGEPCERLYEEVYNAKCRISEQTGFEEDPDVEIIIGNMFDIQKILCKKMFEYGVKYHSLY